MSRLWQKLNQQFQSKQLRSASKFVNIDAHYFEQLEENLILTDMNANLAQDLVAILRKKKYPDQPNPEAVIITELQQILTTKLEPYAKTFAITDSRPFIIMVSGVNGTGKTTTIGKLAYHLIQQGYIVGLIAGDNFRSGAPQQLKIWAERTGASFFSAVTHTDPAALVYETIADTLKNNSPDILIIDTAGRLHNNTNLMESLAKIPRVIQKLLPDAPNESLLVLDATTGQNTLNQVKKFQETSQITGMIMTKLDGTAKGGALPSLITQYHLPVYFLGMGEAIEDLLPFDCEKFTQALLSQK